MTTGEPVATGEKEVGMDKSALAADPVVLVEVVASEKKKTGLKQANTSMSVPPLASCKWAIKHKRNRKATEKQARSNPYCPILGPCPTLGTTASGNFFCKTGLLFSYTRMTN